MHLFVSLFPALYVLQFSPSTLIKKGFSWKSSEAAEITIPTDQHRLSELLFLPSWWSWLPLVCSLLASGVTSLTRFHFSFSWIHLLQPLFSLWPLYVEGPWQGCPVLAHSSGKRYRAIWHKLWLAKALSSSASDWNIWCCIMWFRLNTHYSTAIKHFSFDIVLPAFNPSLTLPPLLSHHSSLSGWTGTRCVDCSSTHRAL